MSKLRFKNIFCRIMMASYVQNRKVCPPVTMLQDKTKLCDSTVIKYRKLPFNRGISTGYHVLFS
jgi:hypothetical protein